MRLPRSFLRHATLGLARTAPDFARRIVARYGLDEESGVHTFDGIVRLQDFAFDPLAYAAEAGLPPPDGAALVLHYLRVGSERGLKPAKGFDPAQYRRENPDVGVAGYEAFAHARRFGWLEGRVGPPTDSVEPPVPSLEELLQRSSPTGATGRCTINVIVPVYKGYADVLRTIAHVLDAQNAGAFDLVVVDDASPEPDVRDALTALGHAGKIRLVRNELNRGFVASVNRGIALDAGRDVILLNSDTAVFGDWLDRIVKVLSADLKCGTVTPMSNAATILSYPIWLKDNALLAGEKPEDIDRHCRDLAFAPIEIPTAIGFCMAIRRACLAAVGPFDEQTFGIGYGEENDFCRRAVRMGWTNLAATNVFVWHKGGGAFGPQKAARVAAAQVAIERLHPGYRNLIRRFIRRDPLRKFRAALDARILVSDARAKVLVDAHTPPAREADKLRMTLVPEISPYFGSYRLVPLDGARTVNLPRLKRPVTQADLGEVLAKIEAGFLG